MQDIEDEEERVWEEQIARAEEAAKEARVQSAKMHRVSESHFLFSLFFLATLFAHSEPLPRLGTFFTRFVRGF